MVITYNSKSMDQPGKVVNPARGQLNRENEYSISPLAPENLVSRDGFGSPVPRQPAHLHTQAETGSSVQCVCVFSSNLFWTSSSLDVPAGVTQEEGHTGFFIHLLSAMRALIFLARRIFSHSFPSSTVKSNFVY